MEKCLYTEFRIKTNRIRTYKNYDTVELRKLLYHFCLVQRSRFLKSVNVYYYCYISSWFVLV